MSDTSEVVYNQIPLFLSMAGIKERETSEVFKTPEVHPASW